MRLEAQPGPQTQRTSAAGWVVPLLIFLTVAAAAGSHAVKTFKLSDSGDARQYVRLYEGASLSDVPGPYRYRILVPMAAAAMPPIPQMFVHDDATRRDRTVLFRFALVNILGLALAATFVFQIVRQLGMAPFEALAGGLLFLGSLQPMTQGTVPLVDAWSYALLAGCLLALLRKQRLLLVALFSVGVFVKETIFLVPLAAWLLDDSWNARWRHGMEFAPATLAYAVFRFILVPSEQPVFWAASTKQFIYDTFVSGLRAGDWVQGGLTFGVLWPLSFCGWWVVRGERDHPLSRWAPLVPLILGVPFVLSLNIGRVWFYAFPVVIPLTLIGIRFCLSPSR